MAWWLEGAISRHFGWVRNSSEAIFCIFLESGKKKKKKNFQEKSVFIGKNRFFRGKSVFIGKNRFLSEKSAIFRRFFFFDFSILISFPAPPKSDFSPKNRPKSVIFLSMVGWDHGQKNRRFFGEKSDFGGAGKDIRMEKSEKKIGEKSPIFSDKNRFFLEIFFFLNFFPDSKNMQKIASDGFQTHPKCLKMAPSNHQAIDCTYYI